VTVDRPAATDHSAGEPATVGTATSTGQRFRILRPHAKGGLGEVFVAQDEELHREVALKEIQPRHADQPDSRARFLLEAEITGGLEHPGIVPVYGLGAYADGRPFYAMRFIRGDSLKDAIERFHRADGPGRDPGERGLALRGLLRRFIDVCNAIAYAHARGVLHRDLKPGNVMLGRYGETLVVDWGLAKAVGRPDGATGTEEGTLRPTAASDSAPTQLGSALGTPAYMSPEQAAGRLDLLGPASDVYSLGATLYCLLTGQAPFTKADKGAVLQKVQRGEFLPPRQVRGSVPPPLDAICRKAMALPPGERYESPRALADDLEHWMADEPVRAYREPLLARLGRWRRRHRPLVAGVTAAALAVLVLGSAGVLWFQEQEASRRAERARRAAALRQGVEAALDKAAGLQKQLHWAEANAVLEQAHDRLGKTGPDDLRRRLARARADLRLVRLLDDARLQAATLVEGKQLDVAGAARQYAAAFRDSQLVQPGDKVGSVAARIRASAVKEQLVAALDDWTRSTGDRRTRVWLLTVARKADPDPWRDRFRDPKVWQDRKGLQRLARQAKVQQLSPQLVAALATVLAWRGGDALGLLTAAQRRSPQDFWLNFLLGNALRAAQKPGEAVGYYRAALALRPKASAVYINLGNALKAQDQVAQSIACYQMAIKLDPKYAGGHTNLGIALAAQGDVAGAIACHKKAIQLEPKSAHAHSGLGSALEAQGDVAGAITCYHKAIALDPNLAMAHNNLGHALKAQGDVAGAIACYHKAIALDPKEAMIHTNLGSALHEQGDVAGAIACHKKAIQLDPKSAEAHSNLGAVLCDAKRDYQGAVAAFRKAIALDPKAVKAHHNLGNALRAQGQVAAAIASYRQALRLDPKNAPAHTALGTALHRQGDVAGAIACYHKAIAVNPKYAKAYGALGQALLQQGHFAEASTATQRVLDLLPQRHPLRNYANQQLQSCQRLLELDARLPALLQGQAQPKDAAEQLALAHLCKSFKKRYAAAARFYAAAFAAQPELAADLQRQHRYNAACAATLAGAGQGKDAGQVVARERARWRQQARAWLQADLGLWIMVLQTGQPQPQARASIQFWLQHWQHNPELAGIRDAAWLVNLPADELRACRQFWADVDALLKRAGSPK
jgi:serine/threonine-protein kinase